MLLKSSHYSEFSLHQSDNCFLFQESSFVSMLVCLRFKWETARHKINGLLMFRWIWWWSQITISSKHVLFSYNFGTTRYNWHKIFHWKTVNFKELSSKKFSVMLMRLISFFYWSMSVIFWTKENLSSETKELLNEALFTCFPEIKSGF